jgi:rhodanese-related sulfurtransferase
VSEPWSVPELSAAEAAECLARGELRAIDVREAYEWDAGRIAEAAHVPLGDLAARWVEVEQVAPLLFVCRSGARSALATEAARGAGVEAWNLAGGMQSWAECGLPLQPPEGHVA